MCVTGTGEYQLWCDQENVKTRFGAIGEHGSIAIVERCIRSIKELLRRILVPYRHALMQEELLCTMGWFNEHRTHDTLIGKTLDEVYFNRPPESERPRLEPRPRWPKSAPCAAPQAPIRGSPGVKLHLEVTHYRGRRHLPIVTLKEAA